MSPGGSGYFTCTPIWRKVTRKFKSGGLHEKHVAATWKLRKHLINRRYNHNCRNISSIYIYITRLASNKIFSRSNKIYQEVDRAKDLSAPRYRGLRYATCPLRHSLQCEELLNITANILWLHNELFQVPQNVISVSFPFKI